METSRRSDGRGPTPVRGPALAYPRAGISGRDRTPEGWGAVSSVTELDADPELFDALAERLVSYDLHRCAGVRVETADTGSSPVLEVLDGPMRGPCRLVGRTDESLVQALVVGTLEGNRAVAEHRCHLRYDPGAGTVTATIRTVWCPGTGFVLPGGPLRETWAHRRLVGRMARAIHASPP